MRRLLLAFVAFSAVTAAQVRPRPYSSKKQAPPCTVAGQVVTAAEGNPLASAHVLLIPDHSPPDDNVYVATSDAEGRFLLKHVAPGRYKFLASRPGYATQHYDSNGSDSGALLSLQPGQQVSGVLFRMTVAAVITGRISNEDGEPMANIGVAALRTLSKEELEDEGPLTIHRQNSGPVPAASALTDDRGQYRIFGLKPGAYYVRATDSLQFRMGGRVSREEYLLWRKLGSQYAPVFYPGVLQFSQAQPVSVNPGEEMQVDLTLRRVHTVTVSGRILDSDGKPAQAMVELQEAGVRQIGEFRSTETDGAGKFSLQGVPPGSYTLFVSQEDSDHVYNTQLHQKLEVGSDNVDSLLITLGRGTTLRGQIMLEGPPAALSFSHVFLSLLPVPNDSDWFGTSANVKKDGSFEIAGVYDGDYALQAFVDSKNGWYLKSARLGPDNILEEGLHVGAESASGTLKVVLSPAVAQLAGSVTQNDKPVVGAHIYLSPDPQTPYNYIRWRKGATDQNGRFVISDVAPGNYRVKARLAVPGASTALVSESESIALSARDHRTVQLVIPPSQQP